jgi:hypothetical protein
MGKRIVHALLTTAAVFAPTAIITITTVLLPSPAVAQATNPAIGTWSGNLPAGPGLTLVFHFAADSAGALTGTLDSPDQGATGIPLDEVTFSGDSLKVRINGLGVEYDAALSADSTKFAGEFRQAGMTFPLEITKGDAPARQPRLGHKPFLVLADHLTRNGIAVLRYHDRGVAGSEGDFAAAQSEGVAWIVLLAGAGGPG